MVFRQILIVTIFAICYITSSPYSLDTVMKRNRPLCGDRLKTALSLICNGMYAAGATKKSESELFNFDDYEELDENFYEESEYEYPFLRKQNMIAMLPRKRRPRTHGIVDECCHKACTESHLRLYCLKSD